MSSAAASNISHRGSILIIDDDRIMPEIIRNIARDSAYEVVGVSDASRLNAADLMSADLVMLDLMMPNIDGVDVVANLAKFKYRGGLILMSGLSEECLESVSTMARSFKLNLIGALHKPINRNILKSMFEKYAYRQFRENWESQNISYVDFQELIQALTNKHVKTKVRMTVSSKDTLAIGKEIVSFWERDGQQLDHTKILETAARDSKASKHFTLFMLRQAYAACLENTVSGREVSIRLSANGLVNAMEDAIALEVLRASSQKPGQLVISLDYRDVRKYENSLKAHYVKLENMGIRIAMDFVSLMQAQNIKFIAKPFARCVLYGANVLHQEYSKNLKLFFEHTNSLGVETVLGDVSNIEDLEKARKAGFALLRSAPLQ